VTSLVTGYQLGSVHLLFHKFSYYFAIISVHCVISCRFPVG